MGPHPSRQILQWDQFYSELALGLRPAWPCPPVLFQSTFLLSGGVWHGPRSRWPQGVCPQHGVKAERASGGDRQGQLVTSPGPAWPQLCPVRTAPGPSSNSTAVPCLMPPTKADWHQPRVRDCRGGKEKWVTMNRVETVTHYTLYLLNVVTSQDPHHGVLSCICSGPALSWGSASNG